MTKRKSITFVLVLALLLSVLPSTLESEQVLAATTTVNDFTSLKNAVEGASKGDTIVISSDNISFPSTINITTDVAIVSANSKVKPVLTSATSGRHFVVPASPQSSGLVVTLSGLSIIGQGGSSVGGGIEHANGTVSIDNCNFEKNIANSGGGVKANKTNINDSTFTSNSAVNDGGAIYSRSQSTITGSIFSHNKATYGGGIFIASTSELKINNSTFTNNSADYGGGFYGGPATTTVMNSTITSNTAIYHAGGGYSGVNPGGNLTIQNSTIAYNTAGGKGGGVYGGYNITIISSSIINNTTNNFSNGSGAHADNNIKVCSSIVSNTKDDVDVFEFNSAWLETLPVPYDLLTVRANFAEYSVIGEPSGFTVNDLYGSSTPALTNNGGKTLTLMPTIKGKVTPVQTISTALPQLDQVGNARPTVGRAYMGAIEGESSDVNNPPTPKTYTVSTFDELRDAITDAIDGDTVKILTAGSIKFSKSIPIRSNISIINGNSKEDIILVSPNNARHFEVPLLYHDVVFTMSDLNIQGYTGTSGGIENKQGTIIINNCQFKNNNYNGYGGGVCANNVIVKSSTFTNNSAYYGGGICSNIDSTLENCTFINNSSDFQGAAVYSLKTTTINSCSIINNNSRKNLLNGNSVFAWDKLNIAFSIISNNKDDVDVQTNTTTFSSISPQKFTELDKKGSSVEYSVFGEPDGFTVNDLFGNSDPILKNNGGKTLTLMPTSKAKVIPVGSLKGVLPKFDQRGVKRAASGLAHIGSVEIESPSSPSNPVTPKPANVTKVYSPNKTFYLKKGKSMTLPLVASATDSKNPKLTWSTSNKKVVTVTQKGKITAKKKGKAKITVKADNGKNFVFTINVVTKDKKVTKISVKGYKKTMKKKQVKYLKVTPSPKTATNAKITFKSSKKGVLAVDKAGKLTAKKKGKATITVKVGTKTKKIKITVK